MALVRWNPWSELFTLQSQMDQLLQSMTPEAEHTRGGGNEQFNLPIDIRQSDEAFTIEASVPGFSPEEVEVTYDDNVLSIKGTYDHQKSGGNGYVRRERRMGSVFRQIALPAEVRSEAISASFNNGVLVVTVPRAQKAEPKRIPVNADAKAGEQHKVVEGTATNSDR